MDTKELKEIAAAATQGIWVDQQHGRAVTVGNATLCEVFSGSVGIEQADANGRFIAAFCPEVAKKLLAEIDRLSDPSNDKGTITFLREQLKQFKLRLECSEKERDQLKAENERQALQFKEWQASHHANYVQVADERDQLQAEVDRLKQENRLLTEHNEFLASSDSRLAPELRAVKDALGLDFTASVSGEAVPLIERLRKLPTCWTEVLEQSEANDQLLDQVLELSADADRWRFVRNAIPNQSPIAVWHEGTKPLLGKMADDAVDAARTMAR